MVPSATPMTAASSLPATAQPAARSAEVSTAVPAQAPSSAQTLQSAVGNRLSSAGISTSLGSGTNIGTSAALGTLSAQDQQFLTQAVQGDQQEMILGSSASATGGNSTVRAFGSLLANDHAMMLANALPLLNGSGQSLPGPSADQLQHIQQISSQQGAAFDRAFVDYMVQDHTTDVQDFQQEIAQGTNPQVRALAESTLPTIEEHLAIAQLLQRSGGVITAASISNTPSAGTSASQGTGTGTSLLAGAEQGDDLREAG